MRHYIKTTSDGMILEAGTVQDDVFDYLTDSANLTVREVSAPVDPQQSFWDGTEVRDLPAKPFPWSVFDTVSETWGEPAGNEELARLKALAVHKINRQIGRTRTHFAAFIEFQDSLYSEKQSEARDYLAATPEPSDLSQFVLMAKEVGKTAPTAQQLAQIWLNKRHMWVAVLADIEGIRADRFIEIDAATTATEIETTVAAALADLIALKGNA